MRLICGLVRLDGGPADPIQLAAMIEALAAQGAAPSVSRRIAGPTAMAVLDFSSASGSSAGTAGTAGARELPVHADGTWLAADLRLDRPAELATALGWPTASDAGTLAFSALARWGANLPDRLDGDFALAFWSPARQHLICARDIMGVRPLCYTYRPGEMFAFASLPRGLHGSGMVAPQLDAVALGRLLVEFYHRSDATGISDIAWVGAGHSLIVTPEGIRHHRSWRPDPTKVGSWRGSAEDAARQLRTLVIDAVTCRLPPSEPVASHLSGGLDSSSIAVIAARSLRGSGRPLHAFSFLPSRETASGLVDERRFVEAVCAQEPDMRLASIGFPPLDTDDIGDPDLPTELLSEPDDLTCAAAARAGANLLLSGAGGDETATYNGMGLHAALLRQGQLRSVLRELRAWARRHDMRLPRAALVRLVLPLLPERLDVLQRRLRGKKSAPADRFAALRFLVPELAEQVRAALPPVPDWRNRPADRIEMLTDSYIVGRLTRWAIIGARHGIAFAYPLLDRRVIDFMLSLPLNRLASRGYMRQPFRDAMEGILPEAVRWRDSKFSPFPDMPLHLANAKPVLLAHVDALKARPAAAALCNMNAIGEAIAAIPEGAAAEQVAHGMNSADSHAASGLLRPIRALRALSLARHASRWGQAGSRGDAPSRPSSVAGSA